MRKIDCIIIHCSASDNLTHDSFKAIYELHISPKKEKFLWGNYHTTGKGFTDIGYHFIVCHDGSIYIGRPIEKIGAHCKGQNGNSIGICLTGNKIFSEKQFQSAIKLCKLLITLLGLKKIDVIGHRMFNNNKTCPNFDVTEKIGRYL